MTSLALNNWAQSFNDMLTKDIVSFEQLGPGVLHRWPLIKQLLVTSIGSSNGTFKFWDKYGKEFNPSPIEPVYALTLQTV